MCKKMITTQVGSLPYDDVDEAVEYSLRHDIPFLPELPKLGDAMMDYIKQPGSISCLETFKRKVAGFETVKIQCVGPATLILGGYDQDEAFSRCGPCVGICNRIPGCWKIEPVLCLDSPLVRPAGQGCRPADLPGHPETFGGISMLKDTSAD